MTTPRSEVPAAPRDFRDTELHHSPTFTAGLVELKEAGGQAPTEALKFLRELCRWVYYALGLPGGSVTLVQAVEGAVRSVAFYQERISTIERNGGRPDPSAPG